MKKKSFIFFCFSFLLSLILINLPSKNLASTYAVDESSYDFVISNVTDWENAKNNIADGSIESASLYFDNLTVSNSLVIDVSGLTISGSITSSSSEPILVVDSSDAISLNLIDCSFNSTKENSIAIKFNSVNHTLNFGGNIDCGCTYFTEYIEGLEFNVTSLITSSNTLQIIAPYDAYNLKAITFENDTTSNIPIRFVSKNNSYSVSQNVSTAEKTMLNVNSLVNVVYDFNGGETSAESYLTSFNFKTNSFAFLSGNLLSRELYNFDGWFGKYKISEELKTSLGIETEYLYFDTNALYNFSQTGYDTSKISDFFKTDVSELDNRYAITSFSYDTTGLNTRTFLPVKFMLDNDQPIELIAKWAKQSFTLSFNSNGGSSVASITAPFDSTITPPTSPTFAGKTFAGWFEDEGLTREFNFDTMPAENTTVYAKWENIKYTLTLKLNNGEEDIISNYEYGDTLSLVVPEKIGGEFAGWFEDEQLLVEFTESTMPNSDLTLYAKYNIERLYVILNTNGGTNYPIYRVDYGSVFARPTNPEKAGYTFYGWFTDNGTFRNEYNFSLTVTENLTLYARWLSVEYTLTFVTNSFSGINSIRASFGEPITEPVTPIFANHTFIGWFEDEELTIPFVFDTMPAYDITIYAKWEAKKQIVLELSPQTYDFDEPNAFYKNFTAMSGFVVQYRVNGNWTASVPKNAGSYDIRVIRAEDATYARFEKVIENGFVINYKQANFTWLIATLFVIWVVELAVILFIKRMKKLKVSKTYALFPIIIGGNSILPNSQFALLCVSGVLALATFIYMIYLIVDVHRVARNDTFMPSKLDNRERFKEDLIFQNNNEGDADYVVDTKTDETFGEKYSAEDIQKMLKNDTFNEETLSKRKFNVEDDSGTNWNKVSQNNGSDVLSKAKDINGLVNGDYENKTVVTFFDDDDEDDKK